MRLKTAVIGPTTYKTFRKELLVLILGQAPSVRGTESILLPSRTPAVSRRPPAYATLQLLGAAHRGRSASNVQRKPSQAILVLWVKQAYARFSKD
jgi:hypothetical protein